MIVNGKYKDIFNVLFDGWFRILEVALVIGIIKHFADSTGNLLLKIIFWISWVIFYKNIYTVLCEDVKYDFLSPKYKHLQKKFDSIIGLIFSTIVIIFAYVVISLITK
jgi:hypothetical protein